MNLFLICPFFRFVHYLFQENMVTIGYQPEEGYFLTSNLGYGLCASSCAVPPILTTNQLLMQKERVFQFYKWKHSFLFLSWYLCKSQALNECLVTQVWTACVCVCVLNLFLPSFRLIAGAPKANWLSNSSVVNPGAIFRCQIGNNPKRDCEILQVGEWNWKFDLTLLVVKSSKQQSGLEKKSKERLLRGSDLISFIRKNVANASIQAHIFASGKQNLCISNSVLDYVYLPPVLSL